MGLTSAVVSLAFRLSSSGSPSSPPSDRNPELARSQHSAVRNVIIGCCCVWSCAFLDPVCASPTTLRSSQVDRHGRGGGAVSCLVDGVHLDRVHDAEGQVHGELVRVRVDGRAVELAVQVQVYRMCSCGVTLSVEFPQKTIASVALPLGASHIRATVQSVTPVTRRFFGATADCWASAAFELPRGTTPNRIYDAHRFQREFSHRHVWSPIHTYPSPAIVTDRCRSFRPLTRLGSVSCRVHRKWLGVERQVRGHMRNRQQTVKPAEKSRIALTVGVSAYGCRRFDFRSSRRCGCCSPVRHVHGRGRDGRARMTQEQRIVQAIGVSSNGIRSLRIVAHQ